MKSSNTTFGVFIVCLEVLLRHNRYIFFILFLAFFPLYFTINRLFLFLDHILFFDFDKEKIDNPVFIMGFNRSGTTFFHHLLSQSKQFTTSRTWDFIVPSISLRMILFFIQPILSFFKIDKVEKKESGHRVGLNDIEEDEMLLFLQKLDSKWISNHLIPWMKYDKKFKSFSREIYIDSEKNDNRNVNSMKFCNQFWKRQVFLQDSKPILSKSNPFIFRLKSIIKINPSAKIIFIVRDPIDTIISFFSMQERVKFGNTMKDKELNLYRKEAYNEIIDWYQETENAKKFLDPNQFIVLTYDDLKANLFESVQKSFHFIGKEIDEEFDSILKEQSEKKYAKKHSNRNIRDFGFTEKKIKEDFDFVYDKYFN